MDRYELAVRMLRWAMRYPQEWGVICGFQTVCLERELEIAEMLRDEGLYELCLMMTMRVLRMQLGDGETGNDTEG